MRRDLDKTLYVFVTALFLCIVAKDLFSDGMFMDGLYYAAIASNMAQGFGTFWSPQLSPDYLAVFYEHPPLAMGIQSVLFRIFGDGIYVERFYSLLTYVLTGAGMLLIWKELTGSFKRGWLSLLFWITVGEALWAASNNMLENTMMVFTTMAVWFYFLRLRKGKAFWLVLAGLSLFLALFTKGFFCLYIWGVPAFDWLFRRKMSFGAAARDTVILVLATLVPVVVLYFFSVAARANMDGYFMQQVVRSVESIQTVDYRLKIVVNFFKGILPQVLLASILYLIARKTVSLKGLQPRLGVLFLFLAVSLSGVLPITISMKQRAFYILSVYPLFSLGFAYYALPVVDSLMERVNTMSKGFFAFRIFTGVTVLTGFTIAIFQVGEVGRDKKMIHDVGVVISHTGENVSLNICQSLHSNYSLHGYFARHAHIGLDNHHVLRRKYFLSENDCMPDSLREFYNKVDIPTEEYDLFQLEN